MTDNLHWYKDAIIYELHIKAFADGNGDGLGDIDGLLQHLDYIADLGATAVWFLPFYPSPLQDDGYDIADYYHINSAYGDMKQFRKMLKECHRRNLKVITELVINHTSDQHAWFQAARRAPKDSAKRNYYVWSDDPNKYRDARIIFQDFEKSNWTWDPVAQQYYWHRFFHHQPDLNFENPEVQEEIFKIIRFWCNLGVDGFRLDAVPYLFEKENTNCENLPETHAFLKSLRTVVDHEFPGTMLLAEANMWPEDSASYFGDGDECHMNYHFPVMPRMFMALQMEDRYPITDIFDQTPAIPENCQWAIFLRNHDELTLEMVTDEERDYMYKAYVKDAQARINLGIRHRLAPLMQNNRKKIELLNYLLFSFPGTPVIYYGDEIGMGDNFYLGDRDGVRTPMQWTSDRNAGFSKANPQKLFLPVIIDPQYHYELINVELQLQNRNSLLWWMKRIIGMRKRFESLSKGSIQFHNTSTAKVLAFTRTYKDETVLVVANLSRFCQPVEIDLRQFEGYIPYEIFSKNKFPEIKEDPYFFTLGYYECQWLQLEKPKVNLYDETLLLWPLSKWSDLVKGTSKEALENTILPHYLSRMRWFGGKSRPYQQLSIIDSSNLPTEDGAFLLLIEIMYNTGLPEMYQLAVAWAAGEQAEDLKDNYPKAVLCSLSIDNEEGVLYDAVYGEAFRDYIFASLAASQKGAVKTSRLEFNGRPPLRKFYKQQESIRSRVLSADQSNTSITYENNFFLKFYRKVDYAINPDLEITRRLSEEAHFSRIPQYLGSLEWNAKNGKLALAMMQELVQHNNDGWTYITEHLRNFNEKLLLRINAGQEPVPLHGSLTEPIVFEDLPEEISSLLDGTVSERIRLLGKRTAEMHIALASIEDKDFQPEEFSLHYQRSVFFRVQSQTKRAFENLKSAMMNFPDELRQESERAIEMNDLVIGKLKNIYDHKIQALKIRIHGDYHLGQTLFTGKDFVILDFEGEPAASYSERRLKRSPLRDVAGMIKSLHYAVFSSLYMNPHIEKRDVERLKPFIELWYHYNSGFFMAAYMKAVSGHGFIPTDKSDLGVLMQTYLIEKAMYEINYELNNRPDWVIIPLKSLQTFSW